MGGPAVTEQRVDVAVEMPRPPVHHANGSPSVAVGHLTPGVLAHPYGTSYAGGNRRRMVTHRPALLELADRVIVVRNGLPAPQDCHPRGIAFTSVYASSRRRDRLASMLS